MKDEKKRNRGSVVRSVERTVVRRVLCKSKNRAGP